MDIINYEKCEHCSAFTKGYYYGVGTDKVQLLCLDCYIRFKPVNNQDSEKERQQFITDRD